MNDEVTETKIKRRGRPVVGTPMEKLAVHFDADFMAKVKQISEKRNVSIAAVIREVSSLGIVIYEKVAKK